MPEGRFEKLFHQLWKPGRVSRGIPGCQRIDPPDLERSQDPRGALGDYQTEPDSSQAPRSGTLSEGNSSRASSPAPWRGGTIDPKFGPLGHMRFVGNTPDTNENTRNTLEAIDATRSPHDEPT